MEQVATLQEVESHWSWLDVEKANEALDIRDEMDALAQKIAEERSKNQ